MEAKRTRARARRSRGEGGSVCERWRGINANYCNGVLTISKERRSVGFPWAFEDIMHHFAFWAACLRTSAPLLLSFAGLKGKSTGNCKDRCGKMKRKEGKGRSG